MTVSSDQSDNEQTKAAARPRRCADEIEKDFLDLLMSGIPPDVAHDKFERLWDETNTLAASSMMTAQGLPYIALLKRMHTAFMERYPR
ncbi:hypothetical protein [Paraburkholderia hospita]|jgi:hypothetical protein|uniref:Uncharacterized protein n=1 Tax=Paraburkholderia hospita TaxID=169430 RepID=A0ABN0FDS0_9BURK|nr:hypothetical protein [Paraburkholderia hospita]EUC13632.1 hypothetical protein PMI06_007580 [Burkholderia sp. BT03]SKC79346.1 hypothetical protein SAMN05445504_2560 [Burkholderia sp. CF099]SOE67730.1 hypothetical protein SAMN05446935_3080 [Burkholderia sp. YR290]AXE98790.1 hypothetical protein CUJ88_10110 [Paraburkholderia hospita]EIM96835.1 hypothetical protein WQE_32251 [Paraburkholderia hospita]